MSRSAKTPQQIGKAFEEEFRLFLKDLTQKRLAAMYRFYDSTSAGGMMMPSQPGDFQLLYERHTHLFELKSSSKHKSLTAGLSGLLDYDQAAQLLFWHRAGAVTHVLFLDQATRRIELWDGAHVATTRQEPNARLKGLANCLQFDNFAHFSHVFAESLSANPRFSALGA